MALNEILRSCKHRGGQSCTNPFALYLFNLGISVCMKWNMCLFFRHRLTQRPTYALPFYWLKILISIRGLYVEHWAMTLVHGPCLLYAVGLAQYTLTHLYPAVRQEILLNDLDKIPLDISSHVKLNALKTAQAFYSIFRWTHSRVAHAS